MSEKKDEPRIILATTNERPPSAKVEIFTPDDMKHVKKLIYLKRFISSVAWHFALPDTIDKGGILTFCGHRYWTKEQTTSAKNFYARLEKERGVICERCAAEYKNAEAQLKLQGYI